MGGGNNSTIPSPELIKVERTEQPPPETFFPAPLERIPLNAGIPLSCLVSASKQTHARPLLFNYGLCDHRQRFHIGYSTKAQARICVKCFGLCED